MDLAKAAALARDCVYGANLSDRALGELAECAEEDLKQAKAIVAYASCNFSLGVPAVEGTLYSLVAQAYLKGLPVSEVSTCAASARLSPQQFSCLLAFQVRPTSLQCSNDNDNEVSELIEYLWENHCSSLGFEVSPAVRFQRTFGSEEYINIPPLGPFRAPASSLLEDIENQAKDSKRARVEDSMSHTVENANASSQTVIPNFFNIVAMVTTSKYFVSLPSRCTGMARCKLLQCITHWLTLHPSLAYELLALEERIKEMYENIQHNRKPWNKADEEDFLVPLTTSEARRLLLALEKSNLVRHLVVERGAQSYLMSHEMIVTDGTERARLLLARMDLPVYCHLPLTYAQLCTEESRQGSSEIQALNEFLLFRPSAIDKALRQMTVECMWNAEGSSVLSLRPEDYARGGATQSSQAWKVVQKLRHPAPVVHSLEDACRVMAVGFQLAKLLDNIIDGEAEHLKEWLYSDGKPDGKLLDGILDSECVISKVNERVSGRA